jgi:hypothetical protein
MLGKLCHLFVTELHLQLSPIAEHLEHCIKVVVPTVRCESTAPTQLAEEIFAAVRPRLSKMHLDVELARQTKPNESSLT